MCYTCKISTCQNKGLRRTRDRSLKDNNNSYFWKQKINYSFEASQKKKKQKNVMFWSKKGSSKMKNTLLRWILQNMLENQTFQRIAKLVMVDSCYTMILYLDY